MLLIMRHEILLQKVSTLDLPDNIHGWFHLLMVVSKNVKSVTGSSSSCSAIYTRY